MDRYLSRSVDPDFFFFELLFASFIVVDFLVEFVPRL